MMRATCLAFLLLATTVAGEVKVPQMPRKVTTFPRETLKRLLSEIGRGNDATCRENGSCYVTVQGDDSTAKVMDMSFSDEDTLLVRTAWNSPHTELGDYPIINDWNSRFRFCKVSIQDSHSETEPGNTIIIMHLDQFMPTGFGDAALKDTLKKSLDIYQASMLAFDKFVTNVYKEAMEKQQKDAEAAHQ